MTEDKLAESIADLMKEAIEEYDELVEQLGEALECARDAVASLPEDALGTGGDGLVIPFYPIRDELIDETTKALTAYRKWKERKGKL